MRHAFVAFVLASVATTGIAGATTDRDIEAQCRPYFGQACSEALGKWLPKLGGEERKYTATTTVRDDFRDPVGTGEAGFLGQRRVFQGSFFVHGMAGPPKGHAVYDPVNHIAYYDEGCCASQHVVLASDVAAPPKKIATRSLLGLRTARGVRLGSSSAVVRAIYGRATMQPVRGRSGAGMLSYERTIVFPAPNSPCDERTRFLFMSGRVTAIEFVDEC